MLSSYLLYKRSNRRPKFCMFVPMTNQTDGRISSAWKPNAFIIRNSLLKLNRVFVVDVAISPIVRVLLRASRLCAVFDSRLDNKTNLGEIFHQPN